MNWYRNEVDEEIKGIDSKVNLNEREVGVGAEQE